LKKETKIAVVLEKYLPEGTVDYVVTLFLEYPVSFRIVKPRKTKLGDFRAPFRNERSQITVNGNLNSYAFLITTVHEFAHLKTWNEYKNKVKPHGQEWKNNFITLMHPLIKMDVLPREIEQALLNSFMNMKASSCTDIQLQRILKKYDVFSSREIILEKLPKYATFALDTKVFEKGELRRTRFLCKEVNTGKQYLIYKLATVEQLQNE
jgi:SprT protein